MKNKMTMLSLGLFAMMFSTPSGYAASDDGFIFNHNLTTATEITSDNTISIYNTGLNMDFEDDSGFAGDFRGSVDGQIDQIDSKNFDLGKFVKQLDVKYKIDTKDTVLLLSVGKMPNGVKTNLSNPAKATGVMGVKLSIEPKQIPAIQEWLDKNNFKINRIDITRYNAESANRLDLNDLNNTNMTSYALYLSHSNNFQTFFVYKTPDSNNLNGVTSKTLGAVYIMSGKLKPQLFAMKHTSNADFMDLDLLVLSASMEVVPNYRANLIYSNAVETMSNSNIDSYDLSISREFKKAKGISYNTAFGIKVDQGSTEDRVVYFRLEAKF